MGVPQPEGRVGQQEQVGGKGEFRAGILDLWCEVGAGEYAWFDTVDPRAGSDAQLCAARAAGERRRTLAGHARECGGR